jgi:hypothetical protein
VSIVPPPGVLLIQSGPERPSIVLRKRETCVCPKGFRSALLEDCCLHAGSIVVADVSTSPKAPRTQFSHRRCYAAALEDCSPDITKEHYFSESVLEIVAPQHLVDVGFRGGTVQRNNIPIRTLASHILCSRHNNVLSPIDATAAWLFGGIRAAHPDVETRDPPVRFVNGCAFERWLLKVACGSLAMRAEAIPEDWLRILFGEAQFPHGWGLHLHIHQGAPLPETQGLETQFARDEAGKIIAWETTMDQFRFVLTLGRLVHRSEDLGARRVRRPQGLTFRYPRGTDFICGFSWPGPFGPQMTIDHFQRP